MWYGRGQFVEGAFWQIAEMLMVGKGWRSSESPHKGPVAGEPGAAMGAGLGLKNGFYKGGGSG